MMNIIPCDYQDDDDDDIDDDDDDDDDIDDCGGGDDGGDIDDDDCVGGGYLVPRSPCNPLQDQHKGIFLQTDDTRQTPSHSEVTFTRQGVITDYSS